MVKHAMQLVLVMSFASLLFACTGGGETPMLEPAAPAKSLSLSLSLSPATQCSNVATIAAGAYHTVGLKEDGTVVAVGYDSNGQVSDVSSWTNITAIAAGAYHTVGLKEDRTVVAVGSDGNGRVSGVSTWSNITAIAAGWYHTVGLKENGTVVAVGNDGNGQVGGVSSWTNIKAIAAGAYHTVGLKENGTVVAVGNDGNGQVGGVSSWTNIKAIAAGAYHTVGLKEDGTVVAVGYDSNGQVSDVSSWTNITAIAAGWYHTVGLKEDGTVVAVGYDINGRVSGVSTWSNIKAIAAGTYDTVGLKEDGTAVAVGNDSNGQVSGVSSWTNIMPICNPAVALTQDVTPPIQDVTPPITISMITGTLGSNGWYVSDVQMTLSATDNDGGSGVKEIHYTVDGTETVVKGSSASNSIASDGTHTVTFYAIDNEGNVETPQKISIKIDKTSPSIPALTVDSAILWPPNHKMVNVLIGGSVADDGGSGIASTIITVTDEYGSCNKTVPGFGSAIPLEAWRESTDMDGRSYTITVVTTDIAGHQSTATKTVLVPHDMR